MCENIVVPAMFYGGIMVAATIYLPSIISTLYRKWQTGETRRVELIIEG
jgi:hypothetical protein